MFYKPMPCVKRVAQLPLAWLPALLAQTQPSDLGKLQAEPRAGN